LFSTFPLFFQVNLARPYTGQSDFTLQIMCHTQLFVTMFAALLIKAEVPILGFSPHLRPIEANICGWYVMNADDATCGVVLFVWRCGYDSHADLFPFCYHFGTRNDLTPNFPCFLFSDDNAHFHDNPDT
jgi:hypothetical protein